jgi:hypothetical protein
MAHQNELQELGALDGRKMVIRNQRQHGFADWSPVNSEAFHIVDLKIRPEQDWTSGRWSCRPVVKKHAHARL